MGKGAPYILAAELWGVPAGYYKLFFETVVENDKKCGIIKGTCQSRQTMPARYPADELITPC
jgi:hypothetical protein